MVKLPEEFRLEGSTVSVRKSGDAVILEPIKKTTWPAHFFDEILIEDEAFARPAQGPMPPAPPFD
jgi:virulence-associated protein VagC